MKIKKAKRSDLVKILPQQYLVYQSEAKLHLCKKNGIKSNDAGMLYRQ